ncbi:GNAT family N-acetyltransferase [Corynebacterium sp. UBA2622]|uniref:GNAT family N-acetyltransferase n=1 Tax=Corynebacterium sp. UBA2622 TaxID=1946393 RepID=UPI0025B84D67|nr:GNAT family protein [Corynebacterium sp. UBA2622]
MNDTMEIAGVRLEPLSPSHIDDLSNAVGNLSDTWYVDHVPTPAGVAAQVDFLRSSDNYIPWAVIDLATRRALGVTCMYNLDDHNKHCELGYTWLGAAAQGTHINAALKYLMLTRAFDDLGLMRAEFRCHSMNLQSRRALEKLGAKFEGELRRHRIMDDGTVRDSCIYSILDYEWPTVRRGLEARLARV